jgi:hypothetical protein
MAPPPPPCGCGCGERARLEKLSAFSRIGSAARSEPHSTATSAPESEESGRAFAGARGRRCGEEEEEEEEDEEESAVGEKWVRRKEPEPRMPV